MARHRDVVVAEEVWLERDVGMLGVCCLELSHEHLVELCFSSCPGDLFPEIAPTLWGIPNPNQPVFGAMGIEVLSMGLADVEIAGPALALASQGNHILSN